MSGWEDWIFGNLPPPRVSLPGGYAAMPDAASVEDRTAPGANALPSRPHDQLNRTRFGPFGQTYTSDQWQYLQSHLPGGQPPTTRLQDPNATVDPSIVANIKLRDQALNDSLLAEIQRDAAAANSPRGPQFSSGPDASQQPSYQQLINFLQSWQGGTS